MPADEALVAPPEVDPRPVHGIAQRWRHERPVDPGRRRPPGRRPVGDAAIGDDVVIRKLSPRGQAIVHTVLLLAAHTTGDGAFGINAMEIDTAARHRAPVLIVVGGGMILPILLGLVRLLLLQFLTISLGEKIPILQTIPDQALGLEELLSIQIVPLASVQLAI